MSVNHSGDAHVRPAPDAAPSAAAEARNLDLQALYEALDAERRSRSLTWAGVTREINALFRDVPCPPIATSTITGLKSKQEVIGNAALQILVWLNRTPESFVPGRADSADPAQRLPRLPPDRILRFDTQAIFRAIDAVRVERRLSWKQIADEIGGFTAAQLTRYGKGAGIGLVAVGRIADWLGRPVASFTVASSL